MDAAFRFFFKYPLLVFQQGDVVLGASRPTLVIVLAVAALAAAALITYRSIVSDGSPRMKRARSRMTTARNRPAIRTAVSTDGHASQTRSSSVGACADGRTSK